MTIWCSSFSAMLLVCSLACGFAYQAAEAVQGNVESSGPQEIFGFDGFRPDRAVSGKEEIALLFDQLLEDIEVSQPIAGIIISSEYVLAAPPKKGNDRASHLDLDWERDIIQIERRVISGNRFLGWGMSLGGTQEFEDATSQTVYRAAFEQRSLNDGALVWSSDDKISDRVEAEQSIDLIASGDVLGAVSQSPLENRPLASLMFEGSEKWRGFFHNRFFPWTKVDRFSNKPFLSSIDKDQLSSCSVGKYKGMECWYFQASDETGFRQFAVCPALENLVVFYKVEKNGDSTHFGKTLKAFNLQRLEHTMVLSKIDESNLSFNFESFDLFQKIGEEIGTLTRTSLAYSSVAREVSEADLVAKSEILNGTQVIQADDSQITWIWQDNNIQKKVDAEVVDKLKQSEFSPPKNSSALRLYSQSWLLSGLGLVILAACCWLMFRRGNSNIA